MYVQNGVQKIEVFVRRERGGGGEADKAGADKEVTDNTHGENKGSLSKRKRMRRIITNGTHAIAVTRQIANLRWNYFIGGIGVRHGDEAFQDSINRSLEVVGDTANFASSVAMGAVYGAWGGPIGSALGAIMGGLSTGVSIATKYDTRERTYGMKVFKENHNIEYKRARANINLTTGRLR